MSLKIVRVPGTVTTSVLPDDTVKVMHAKLSLASGRDDVYVWAATDIRDDDAAARASRASAFVTTLMRGRHVVSAAEARDAFSAVSGLPRDALRLRLHVKAKDVHRAVAAVGPAWTQVLEPVSLRHYDRGYPLFWPVSPFQTSDGDQGLLVHHPHETVTHDDMTVEAFLTAPADRTTLHYAARADVPETSGRDLFFVRRQTSAGGIDARALAEADRAVREATSCPAAGEALQGHAFLKKMEVRRIQEGGDFDAIDLGKAFDAVRVSAEVPYATVARGAMHKMYAKAFATDAAAARLHAWIATASSDVRPDLLVRGAYGEGLEFALWISDRLDVTVRYDFHHHAAAAAPAPPQHELDLGRAAPSLPLVNGVLAQVRAAVGAPEGTLADLTPEDLTSRLLYRMTYGLTLMTAARTPTLAELAAVARQRMQPVFLVTPPLKKTGDRGLQLEYKRRDNYSEDEHVRRFISMNRNALSPEEMVARLASTFALDAAQAAQAYEDSQARDASELVRYGSRAFVRSRFWGGIQLTVMAQGSVGIGVVVRGVTRPQYVARINAALRCMMTFAASGGAAADARRPRASPASLPGQDQDEGDQEEEEREVDAELLAELQQDVQREAKTATAATETAPHRYTLQRLYEADPKLFPKGLYPSRCAKASQPIVITAEEKARSRPTEAVQAGSTPERRAANFFICPDVWCPKTRTPLSHAQLEALGGRCPDPAVTRRPWCSSRRTSRGACGTPGCWRRSSTPRGCRCRVASTCRGTGFQRKKARREEASATSAWRPCGPRRTAASRCCRRRWPASWGTRPAATARTARGCSAPPRAGASSGSGCRRPARSPSCSAWRTCCTARCAP